MTTRATGDAGVTGRSATMRAVLRPEYGGPEVLRIGEAPRPRPAAGEVLVRVRAAGVDRGAWHLMVGRPLLVRPVIGWRRPRNPVLGLDLAGTVVEVGPGVTRFAVGEEVMGIGRSTFAELATARVDRLVHRPADLPPAEASVVAISGITALQAVRAAGVSAGQRVLVTGASGGVGSWAVQLAAAYGAEVIATCSPAKADLVTSLGATRVLDRTREDFVDAGPYDAVLDLAGGPTLRRLRRALRPTGTAVIVGSEEGGPVTGGLDRNLRAALLSLLTRQRLTGLVSRERGADVAELVAMIGAGTVRPCLERTYPLAEAATALRDLQEGRVRGKVALVVD